MLLIQQIARHRNGVAGNGFYAVLFRCDPKGELAEEAGPLFVASVFPERGNVAVLRVGDMLDPETGVRFAENSWRGDVFEQELREACRSWEAARMVALGWTASREEALAKLAEEERDQEQERAIVDGAVRAWRESGEPQTAPEPTAPKRSRHRRS